MLGKHDGHRMLPWDMERLTRWQVFEVYLEPATEDEQGMPLNAGNSMTHREQAFFSLQGAGKSWLEAEREYQEWQRVTKQRPELERTSSGGE